jgi:hypothetical protein
MNEVATKKSTRDKRQVTSGKRQAASDKWQATSDKWQVASDKWQAIRDTETRNTITEARLASTHSDGLLDGEDLPAMGWGRNLLAVHSFGLLCKPP